MIEQINNHSEIAIDQLLAQFKEKPKIEKLITAQAKQIQDLETAAFEVYTGRALQSAFGATLDRWGNLLAEPRAGRNDETYRAGLFFKITRNVALGTPNDVITIFQVLSGATQVRYREEYPATVLLVGLGVSGVIDMDLIAPYIKAAAPAGVKIGQLTYSKTLSVFGFLGYPSDFLGSLGTLDNPAIGGSLASNVEL